MLPYELGQPGNAGFTPVRWIPDPSQNGLGGAIADDFAVVEVDETVGEVDESRVVSGDDDRHVLTVATARISFMMERPVCDSS